MVFRRRIVARTLLAGLLLGATAVGVQWYCATTLSGEESDALAALNRAREQAGAPGLTPEWRLTLAARRQAEHMAETSEVAHNRTRLKGILGLQETPELRRTVAFYLGRGAEALARVFTMEPKHAITSLLHAPYHRISLLDPGAAQVGVGLLPNVEQSVTRLDTALTLGGYPSAPAETIVVWPANGVTDVPAFFLPGTETPNPAPESKSVGYIVTVQGATDQKLDTESFTLRRVSTGELVAGRVATAETDVNLPEQAAAFIPAHPLEWGTEYQADFQGNAAFGPVRKSWSFHTGPAPEYGLKVEGEDPAAGMLHISLSSPVQPAHVCYKTSSGAAISLAWISPERFRMKVNSCDGETCAVQLYLSTAGDCKSKKARINALFGGDTPKTAPTLIGRS